MSSDAPRTVVDDRSDEQRADEAAFKEIEETILNVEAAVGRAERAVDRLRRDKAATRLITALDEVIAELEASRRRLQQRTYFAGERSESYEAEWQGQLFEEQQRMF